MPELPEVEVVRLGLEPAVAGARVGAVELHEPRSLRRHVRELGDFETLLRGARLSAPVRRGKFLWLPIERSGPPLALLAHLGMSGQLLLRSVDRQAQPRTRVRILLQPAGRPELFLDFVDQRMFGSLAVDRLVPTDDGGPGGLGSARPLVPAQAAHIARDPLDPAFDEERFIRRVRASRSGVKRALLDQRLVSGIGNIYADEALWAAGLHYERPGSALSRAQLLRLLTAVREVMLRALAEGGTSFDAQSVNVNGASGYFSRSLTVYGRQGLPCARCGTVLRREPFMNRSSHLCPRCQPRPRARRSG